MGVKKTTNQKKHKQKQHHHKHTRAQWNRIKKTQAVSLTQTPSHQLKRYWAEVLRAL